MLATDQNGDKTISSPPLLSLRFTLWAYAALVGCWIPTATSSAAQSSTASPMIAPEADVAFALLRYQNGHDAIRRQGLVALAWEIRKRTSVAMDLQVFEAQADSDAIFNHPLLVWQGDSAFAPLSDKAVDNLRIYLLHGGSLWIDISDGSPNSPFEASVRRELRRILPQYPLETISTEHVLYRAFYLIQRHGGRVANRASLDGIILDKRLAVMLSANDMAGAMAKTSFGQWAYDVGSGGDTVRELTFRLGINWLIYVLSLDYKADQVHLPFILQRRH